MSFFLGPWAIMETECCRALSCVLSGLRSETFKTSDSPRQTKLHYGWRGAVDKY